MCLRHFSKLVSGSVADLFVCPPQNPNWRLIELNCDMTSGSGNCANTTTANNNYNSSSSNISNLEFMQSLWNAECFTVRVWHSNSPIAELASASSSSSSAATTTTTGSSTAWPAVILFEYHVHLPSLIYIGQDLLHPSLPQPAAATTTTPPPENNNTLASSASSLSSPSAPANSLPANRYDKHVHSQPHCIRTYLHTKTYIPTCTHSCDSWLLCVAVVTIDFMHVNRVML